MNQEDLANMMAGTLIMSAAIHDLHQELQTQLGGPTREEVAREFVKGLAEEKCNCVTDRVKARVRKVFPSR